jgi:hypothetical protein
MNLLEFLVTKNILDTESASATKQRLNKGEEDL